jgi:hypothetical protein
MTAAVPLTSEAATNSAATEAAASQNLVPTEEIVSEGGVDEIDASPIGP